MYRFVATMAKMQQRFQKFCSNNDTGILVMWYVQYECIRDFFVLFHGAEFLFYSFKMEILRKRDVQESFML